MFSQFIMVATETYAKYITRDWQNFFTRVEYFDKTIKLTGSICCEIATYVVIS